MIDRSEFGGEVGGGIKEVGNPQVSHPLYEWLQGYVREMYAFLLAQLPGLGIGIALAGIRTIPLGYGIDCKEQLSHGSQSLSDSCITSSPDSLLRLVLYAFYLREIYMYV